LATEIEELEILRKEKRLAELEVAEVQMSASTGFARIANSDKYKADTPEQQKRVRDVYFKKYILPQVRERGDDPVRIRNLFERKYTGTTEFNKKDADDNYDRLTLQLAERGVASAQYHLALKYDNGQRVPKDYKEAVKWYRLAAEQGHDEAQYNLGNKYDKGQGVQQDYKEAVKWWRFSSEQGNALAQYNLGLMYAKGEGVPQDYALAHKWWNLAGSNGVKQAVGNRNILEKKMTQQQIAEAQRLARNWKPKK
jgi:hypothetical protein